MGIGGVTGTIGTFMVYLLGAFLPWRMVAFACVVIPCLNICVAFFVSSTHHAHKTIHSDSITILFLLYSPDSRSTSLAPLQKSCERCSKSVASPSWWCIIRSHFHRIGTPTRNPNNVTKVSIMRKTCR